MFGDGFLILSFSICDKYAFDTCLLFASSTSRRLIFRSARIDAQTSGGDHLDFLCGIRSGRFSGRRAPPIRIRDGHVLLQNEQPDRRRQVAVLSAAVDPCNHLRKGHISLSRQSTEGVPELVFQADACLAPTDDDGSLNDWGTEVILRRRGFAVDNTASPGNSALTHPVNHGGPPN